jgi:SAM-dependent methyltransferase
LKEWFNDEEFWGRFAPIIFDEKHWAEVPRTADGLTRLARLDLYDPLPRARAVRPARGPFILDLCCGFGRITSELARRGFAAVGVDITETYLQTAREDAAHERLDIEYIREDIRRFRRPGFFDVVANLYISFGYFKEKGDDLKTARNVYDSLKPGGAFIIETLGKEIAVRDFVEAEWFERAGYTVLTEYAPVDSWEGLKNRWVLIGGDGKRMEKTFVQRLYAATELQALLQEAGFSQVEIYGDWDESPYDNYAEKLIAVGRRGSENGPPR